MNYNDNVKNTIKNLKLGYKLQFFGLYGCINCAFLLPLLSLADRVNMFDLVEEIHFDSKEEYKLKVGEIIAKYVDNVKNLPTPVILIQKEDQKDLFLANPETVTECAIELMDNLNRMGDSAIIDYMDGELDLKILFTNLLLKLSTNLILPKNYKKNVNPNIKE